MQQSRGILLYQQCRVNSILNFSANQFGLNPQFIVLFELSKPTAAPILIVDGRLDVFKACGTGNKPRLTHQSGP
jgi:hypothetical protein